ncbi:MAG: hypothetical protein QGG72_13530 [Verrucomicrobiota bacterium]|nr:hypothetical protein [Verrucomicrobiota bacterium]
MKSQLIAIVAAVVLVGCGSIQSIQPLILSMTGFNAKAVSMPPLRWKQ